MPLSRCSGRQPGSSTDGNLVCRPNTTIALLIDIIAAVHHALTEVDREDYAS